MMEVELSNQFCIVFSESFEYEYEYFRHYSSSNFWNKCLVEFLYILKRFEKYFLDPLKVFG